MASINFNNLATIANDNELTFIDYYLDFAEDNINSSQGFVSSANGVQSQRDLKVAINLNAIRNSISNLFNTSPGERYLLPTYGLDLRRYLFSPITEMRGLAIGRDIYRAIEVWEPRVKVAGVNVNGQPDQNQYTINIQLQVPFLKERLDLQSTLRKEGFTVL